MQTLGERIAYIREKLGYKQEDFAKALGLKSAAAVSKWESNDREPGINICVKIASMQTEKSLSWLLVGDDSFDKEDPYDIFNAGFKKAAEESAKRKIVPYMQKLKMRVFPIVSKISAGTIKEYFHDLDPEKTINIPYKHDNCVALIVDGDSMANKIDHGDIILVDLYKNIKDGDIVAIALKNGAQMIKRFKRINGTIILYSDNNKYTPITIKDSEILTVKKVVKIIKDV